MNRHYEGYKRAVDQNWGRMANIGFLGQALPAHLVGGCGARAVSRKTPIYFIIIL